MITPLDRKWMIESIYDEQKRILSKLFYSFKSLVFFLLVFCRHKFEPRKICISSIVYLCIDVLSLWIINPENKLELFYNFFKSEENHWEIKKRKIALSYNWFLRFKCQRNYCWIINLCNYMDLICLNLSVCIEVWMEYLVRVVKLNCVKWTTIVLHELNNAFESYWDCYNSKKWCWKLTLKFLLNFCFIYLI